MGLRVRPRSGGDLVKQMCANTRLAAQIKAFTFSYHTQLTGDRATTRTLADQLQGAIDRELRTADLILVGHSLGGLIGRSYMQEHSGGDRVKLLITLATPHRGTHEQTNLNVLAV